MQKISLIYTKNVQRLLFIDTTLPSNNLLRFSKNLNITNDDNQ